jgi:hypothetical protein
MTMNHDVVSAKNACILLKAWAQENNLLSNEIPVQGNSLLQQDENAFDSLCISSTGEAILRRRTLVDIFFNEAEKKVIVLTAKKISQAELKALPKIIFEEIKYEFIHAATASAGTPQNGLANYSYYVSSSDKYCCGSSIHPARIIGAGTMGCLVRDSLNNLYGLTNNHVSGMCNYSTEGEKIIAPGHIDISAHRIDPFTIGYHYKSAPMTHGLPDNVNVSLNLDAAILKLADSSLLSSMQGCYFDTPIKVLQLVPGQKVKKVGRTTGLTEGYVVGQSVNPMGVNTSVPGYGTQTTFYDSIFLIKHADANKVFSSEGDSGSLVVIEMPDGDFAGGLIFAGDQYGNSYALPIQPVLDYFDVTLVSGHNL